MNSAALVAQLKIDEEVRFKPYDDATGRELKPGDTLQGQITIGIGANLSAGIDGEIVSVLLEWALRRTMADLDRALPWWRSMSEKRQQALCNAAFNMGISRLLTFKKALGFLQAGRWDAAAAEFKDSKWHGQVGPRAERIIQQIKEG